MSIVDLKTSVVDDLTRAAGNMESRVLFRSTNVLLQVCQMTFIAVAAAFFIKWWALLWLTVMFAVVYASSREREEYVPAGIVGSVAIAVNSAIYLSIGAATWIVGGEKASFLAGVMLCTQALFATAFFSFSRANYFANYAPALLFGVITPFFVFHSITPLVIILLCIGFNYASAEIVRRNRNEMMSEALRIQSEMEAARDASIAKSQFIATMSHELRTPLNAVIGYAEILEEEMVEEGRKANAEDAARIHRSARSLLHLINEILDFSKIEAGRMDMKIEKSDVREIVNDVKQTVSHLTNANNTEVLVELAPEAETVWTDGQRLRQCLLNLMSNAAKFTHGGTIKMSVAIETQDGAKMLRVDVADTGCGISDEDAARMFQPFTQVDSSFTRKQGGTGLGLVITKKLSELLGGDISFVSAEGKGSTFTLRIVDHAQAQQESTGAGPLVLVIEDDPAARDLTRRALARLPVEISEAHSASSGRAAAYARKPQLIMLDLNFPDGSGWELLAEFKANEMLRDVPVLIVSSEDQRKRALTLGACEHLVKPVDAGRIAATVLRYALSDAPQTEAKPAAAAKSAAA